MKSIFLLGVLFALGNAFAGELVFKSGERQQGELALEEIGFAIESKGWEKWERVHSSLAVFRGHKLLLASYGMKSDLEYCNRFAEKRGDIEEMASIADRPLDFGVLVCVERYRKLSEYAATSIQITCVDQGENKVCPKPSGWVPTVQATQQYWDAQKTWAPKATKVRVSWESNGKLPQLLEEVTIKVESVSNEAQPFQRREIFVLTPGPHGGLIQLNAMSLDIERRKNEEDEQGTIRELNAYLGVGTNEYIIVVSNRLFTHLVRFKVEMPKLNNDDFEPITERNIVTDTHSDTTTSN